MFSVDQQKKLAHWFKQVSEHAKQCQACGRSDEFFSHPDLVCAPFVLNGQTPDLSRALHFLVRECRACGFTMMFNAERIGIL